MPRKLRSKSLQYVFMTRKDWIDFTSILSREFVDLRYLDRDYWNEFIDRAAMARRDAERRDSAGGRGNFNVIMRDPGTTGPRLFETFPAGRFVSTHVWRVPKGWRAKWTPPNEAGYRFIENEPNAHLEIVDQSNAVGYGGEGLEKARFLYGSTFNGYWQDGDEAGRRFVARAFALLSRETTRLFHWLDKKTLKPVTANPTVVPHFRAGRGATAWANRGSNRDCQGYFRPVWIGESRRRAPGCSRKRTES